MKEINDIIPWAQPIFVGKEKEYLNQALSSTWISGGPFVERLEQDFKSYCRSNHALTVSNGTTAIHLAYLALDIGPGDEVIVPGFGFLAAANIALHMGATPVFADVAPKTWCLTADNIERCLSKKTKVIVPVHTYGNICPMDGIMNLAEANNIAIIEDTAEAFASRYKGKFAGTFGTIGTFSFQATKTITTGEGGMVVTDDQKLSEKMALYRSHGMLRKKYYWHELPGHNFRLTNLQAALGCAQIEHLDTIIQERSRIHRQYNLQLEGFTGVTLQYFPPEVSPVLWAMAVKLDPKAYPQGRDRVIEEMLEAKIETRPGFYTPRNFSYFRCPTLPICEEISSQVISLPTYTTLSNEQIAYICQQLFNLKR